MPAPLILHVVFRFSVGGLENGLVNLLNHLPRERWRHAVMALTDVDPAFASRVTREDVRFISLDKAPGHAISLYPQIFRFCRTERPAIVHTRNLAALEATLPAWASGVACRVHGEHGRSTDDLDGLNMRHRWTRRIFRPFVNRYIALSPDLEVYLRNAIGIPAERIEQIYNGVDTTRFKPAATRASAIDGCPFQRPDHWLVGTIGRMESVKDQVNLAEAFVRAVRKGGDAASMRLVMVGDGPLRPQVEAVLEQGGVRDLAWLPGERADVPQILQGLDCFVLPSLAEGVSNTILEAMASAVPVVATSVGANGQLVDDGTTGMLVPRANADALAQAMLAYCRDRALARRHGKNGRQIVERKFSLERMVERYDRLYNDLLNAPSKVRTSEGVARPGRHRSV